MAAVAFWLCVATQRGERSQGRLSRLGRALEMQSKTRAWGLQKVLHLCNATNPNPSSKRPRASPGIGVQGWVVMSHRKPISAIK